MTEDRLPDYALHNRDHWTENNASYTDASARSAWERDEVSWGLWGAPESEVQALPALAGRDVIELGCGTAYFGAWLKRRGAGRVVGVDVTPAQLDTARRMDAEFGLGLEFLEANAESVPLPDSSFDVAVSEYGASIWCDPHRWIPEAARLLRPGGDLVFMRNSTIAILCAPDEGCLSDRLVRPQQGLGRLDWVEKGKTTTEFHCPGGEMLRLLRKSGFEVLDLIELYAGEDATDHPFYDYVSADWARKWPAEEIWTARRR